MAETRHTADQGIFREWAVGRLATFASASDGTLSLLSDVELPEYYSFVIFHVARSLAATVPQGINGLPITVTKPGV